MKFIKTLWLYYNQAIIVLLLLILIEVSFFSLFHIRGLISTPTRSISEDNPNITFETIESKKEIKNFRSYSYAAFLGWQIKELNGKYVNVDKDGFRVSKQTKSPEFRNVIHLFGGSTMWGFGVSDLNTIPSLLSLKLNISTKNYGEQAYNSRQSLNRLIDNIDKIKKDDIVIFFDGINDVLHNCRVENSYRGHAREGYFKKVIKEDRDNFFQNLLSFAQQTYTFKAIKSLSVRFNGIKNSYSEFNSCKSDIVSTQVADFIFHNWEAMQAIVVSKGAIPFCFLQPNPYYPLDQKKHNRNQLYKAQITTVYPKIIKKASELSCFKDLTNIKNFDFYIDDCCHVNEVGNAVLAEQLAKAIKLK